jgi:phosphotransferase system  glucose/maltose/N-acetylglucosamine-specific IIC component
VEQPSSTAAQVIIAIIPIVGIVMGSTVVFFYLLWNHKRKTLLIQAGQYSKPPFDLLSFSLLTGLLLSSVGIALTIFLAIALGVNFGLLGGIIPLAMGIGLLAYYRIKRGGNGS